MENRDKQYRGFAVKAPPHLNPKNNPNRYVFGGVSVSTGDEFNCGLTVIRLPGFVTPEEFAADVAAMSNGALPGDLLTYFPAFKLGKFSYTRPGTGDTVEGKAQDMEVLKPEQLKAPPQTYKTPSPTLKPLTPRPPLGKPSQPLPTPRKPAPGLEKDNGMTPSF